MVFCSKLGPNLALLFVLGSSAIVHAQDPTVPDAPHRGRKYKAPPDTSHIEVLVTRDGNGKPLMNAAVIFRPIKDGHDEGNLEVKTNSDGKAIIDVIPTGSDVGVQVIADGYATYAGSFLVKEDSRVIEIKMIRPRAQISTYVDSDGKASDRKVGVQEPGPKLVPTAPGSSLPTSMQPSTAQPTPGSSTDPKATPGTAPAAPTKPTVPPPVL